MDLGGAIAVVLPVDWARGNDVHKGTEVEIEYDEVVIVKPLKPAVGSE